MAWALLLLHTLVTPMRIVAQDQLATKGQMAMPDPSGMPIAEPSAVGNPDVFGKGTDTIAEFLRRASASTAQLMMQTEGDGSTQQRSESNDPLDLDASVSNESESSTSDVVEDTIPTPQPDASSTPSLDHPVDRATTAVRSRWWKPYTDQPLLTEASTQTVAIDLPLVVTQAIQQSPRITALSRRTSIAYEQIIQQDAVFDTSVLMQSGVGRVNDPVGNTLTTGGPPRLIQDDFSASAGIQKRSRRGALVDLSQEIGTLTSNSQFFDPLRQGNSRLSLSITQPMLAGAGRAYNTRLITQASIDSRIAWAELRSELEQQLVDTQTAFWRLYERRCQLVQQRDLIRRGSHLGDIIEARMDFDAGPLHQVKVRRRLSDHLDREIELKAQIRRSQIQLQTLLGGDVFGLSSPLTVMPQSVMSSAGTEGPNEGWRSDGLEFIPIADSEIPPSMLGLPTAIGSSAMLVDDQGWALRDALVRGLENRPDVRAATEQLSAAGLSVRVTRNELQPRLDAVIDAYLAGLNGNNNFFRSFGDQFSAGGPGISATLQYELPWGNRAARSRHREAKYLYQQRAEELRQTLLDARGEIEAAMVSVDESRQLRDRRWTTLVAAIEEEQIATQRFAVLAGEASTLAVMLEDLLETQTRRTAAEQALVTAEVNLILSLVQLQRAMGTLLTRESVEPMRPGCSTHVEVITSGQMWHDAAPFAELPEPAVVNGHVSQEPIEPNTSGAASAEGSSKSFGMPDSLGLINESNLIDSDQSPPTPNKPQAEPHSTWITPLMTPQAMEATR
ncbi:MAG: TolC family protein [Planctomycetota bacterium]